jgi:hypothetical protein
VIPSSPFIEGSSDVPPPIPTSDRGEDEKERNAAHARRTRKKTAQRTSSGKRATNGTITRAELRPDIFGPPSGEKRPGGRMNPQPETTSLPGNGGTRIASSAARSFLAPIHSAEKAERSCPTTHA